MRNTLAVVAALVLSLSSLSAQTASFTSYTKPCNATAMSITGLPKLGTTFTVNNVLTPGLCTRKFCGCNVGPCNTCQGAVLVFGLVPIVAPIATCPLHVLPMMILPGNTNGQIPVAVPNDSTLMGVKFRMQRADVVMIETIDASCNTSYPISAINGMSDAVEGTCGL
ncbi:MAG: hypothetical protein KDC87_18380 [Planctomycetes bacterium]|nr:hypothetical protein [Planctomycetota bacterium]MCB9889763.1 hypothetical protein [Planctomycetota bacterium]